MKLLLILLTLSSVATAENYTFIGRDGERKIQHKRVSIHEKNPNKTLSQLKEEYPNLSWSVAKEGEADYDLALPKEKTDKELYQEAVTIEEKLAIIEKILDLNQ